MDAIATIDNFWHMSDRISQIYFWQVANESQVCLFAVPKSSQTCTLCCPKIVRIDADLQRFCVL